MLIAMDHDGHTTGNACFTRLKRELEVEEKSSKKQSLHFILHYQGDRTSRGLQQDILATLDCAHDAERWLRRGDRAGPAQQ